MDPQRRLLIAAVVLAAATAVAILPAVRYRRVVPELADDAGGTWSTTGCGARARAVDDVELAAADGCPQPWAAIRLASPRRWRAVAVAARVTAGDLRFGPAGWQRPLLEVTAFSDTGRQLDRAVVVVPVAAGDGRLEHWSRVIRVPAGAAQLRVRLINAAAAGSVRLAALELRGVEGRRLFPWLGAGLGVAWGGWLMVAAATWLASCRRRWAAVLAVAVVVALTAGAMIPRATVVALVTTLAAPFAPGGTSPAATAATPAGSRSEDDADPDSATGRVARALEREWRAGRLANLGHFAAFFVLALSMVAARPRDGLRTIVPAVLLLAVATELLQGLTVSRNPRLEDLGLDLAGALVALLLTSRTARGPRSQGT